MFITRARAWPSARILRYRHVRTLASCSALRSAAMTSDRIGSASQSSAPSGDSSSGSPQAAQTSPIGDNTNQASSAERPSGAEHESPTPNDNDHSESRASFSARELSLKAAAMREVPVHIEKPDEHLLQRLQAERRAAAEAEAANNMEEGTEGRETMDEKDLAEVLEAEPEARYSWSSKDDLPLESVLELESGALTPEEVPIKPVKPPRDAKVARLAHGLNRVLFSPGVHSLRDPRTGVWNFTRTLGWIPEIDEFAYHRLPQYITASEDPELAEMSSADGLQYFGSTSTLTQSLAQIYFTLSGSRGVDTSILSEAFREKPADFTAGATLPALITVRHLPNGRYAVDNNKEYSVEENVLSDYGRILEKQLTAEPDDFKRFMNSSPESAVPESERTEREAYCYSRGQKLLMRSQLDCQDSRLPGNGTFDIKTRACFPIRMDRANYKANSVYDISKATGLEGSYEREYYDLMRSGMIKYNFQARIGQMDGIFVAYHNTKRCFGFQYLPLAELDERLFGSTEMGTQVFQFCVALFERLLDRATSLFPNQSINMSIRRSTAKKATKNELFATVSPTEWDQTKEQPMRVISLTISHLLDGTTTTNEDFRLFEDAEEREKQKWSLEYSMKVSADDAHGNQAASRIFGLHKMFHTNMNSLYLPEGKQAWEMNLAAKRKAKAVAKAAEDENAVTAADTSDAEPAVEAKAEAEAEIEPASSAATASEPPIEISADEDEVATGEISAPEKNVTWIRWNTPTSRVMALRTIAAESGQEYNKRRESWPEHSKHAYWWYTEEKSVKYAKHKEDAIAARAEQRKVERDAKKRLRPARKDKKMKRRTSKKDISLPPVASVRKPQSKRQPWTARGTSNKGQGSSGEGSA